MDFSWYKQDDLMNLVFDRKNLAKMDHGDMVNLVQEMAVRLQRANDELQVLGR